MLGHPETNRNPVEKSLSRLFCFLNRLFFFFFFSDCDRSYILILTYPSAITGGKVFHSIGRYIVDRNNIVIVVTGALRANV